MWVWPSAASGCGLVTNTLGGRGAAPNSGAPTRSGGAPGKGRFLSYGPLVLRVSNTTSSDDRTTPGRVTRGGDFGWPRLVTLTWPRTKRGTAVRLNATALAVNTRWPARLNGSS